MNPVSKSNRAGVVAYAPMAKPIGRLVAYEDRLSRDPEWAMSEGSRFVEDQGAVQATLKKVTARLRALGIEYAVVGGMALFHHGVRRFTEDVDLLVTRDGLKETHRQLEGQGYLPVFEGSKNLRDTDNGVKIEFVVTGDFPGDGKPKPVAFPEPAGVSVETGGIRYLILPTLVELKIASGMTSADRLKDLADVIALIKVLSLPAAFATGLNPFVHEKYAELWQAAHPPAKRYARVWKHTHLPQKAQTLADLIAALPDESVMLRAMLADNVVLDPRPAASNDAALLVTSDPDIARKYEMHDESEFWNR